MKKERNTAAWGSMTELQNIEERLAPIEDAHFTKSGRTIGRIQVRDAAGKVSRNVLPSPSTLSTAMRPP